MEGIPPAIQSDAEDVVWALQTADALWKRNERIDAIVWLRRAAQAAGDANDDERAVALARDAAELAELIAAAPQPQAGPGSADRQQAARQVDDLLRASAHDFTAELERAERFRARQATAPDPRELEAQAPPPMQIPPDRESVPHAAQKHAGMLDPWSAPPAEPASPPSPPPPPPPAAHRSSFPSIPVPENARLKSDPPPPPPPTPPPQPAVVSDDDEVVTSAMSVRQVPQVTSVAFESEPPTNPRHPPAPAAPRPPSIEPVEAETMAAPPPDPVPASARGKGVSGAPRPRTPSAAPRPPAVPKPPPLPKKPAKPPVPPARPSSAKVAAAPPAAPAPPPPSVSPSAEARAELPPPPAPSEPVPVQATPAAEAPPPPPPPPEPAIVAPEPIAPPPPVVEAAPAPEPSAPGSKRPSRRPASARPPSAKPPAADGALDLDGVDAFADLPDDAREAFAKAAKVSTLSKDEEVSQFALAYVVSGEVDASATMVDAPAVRFLAGSVLRSRGSIDEKVPLRLICASDAATVAIWSEAAVAEAFKSCPWVEEDLRAAANQAQALAGVTVGPLGERLDRSLRDQVMGRLELRVFLPGEVVVAKGKAVPGLVVVGVGDVELVDGDVVKETLGSGDFLFADAVLGAGAAPFTARVGEGGALAMCASRAVAQELLVTCPPLLELFAGM